MRYEIDARRWWRRSRAMLLQAVTQGGPNTSSRRFTRRDRLRRRLAHRAHPERLIVNAAQHRGLFEAVREGNAEKAHSRLKTHLDWGRRFTLARHRRLGSDRLRLRSDQET
jgi:DNA-binding GntR family transcriptional regulator